MTARTRTAVALLWIVALCEVGTANAIDRPEPVSPGDRLAVAAVLSRCPTFSWSAGGSASRFELAVYHLPDGGSARTASRVLQVSLPGGARAWTPAEVECLRSGSRYAWLVRTTTSDGTSEWSDPMLFHTVEASPVEVREAVEVVRAYLERIGTDTGVAPTAELPRPKPAEGSLGSGALESPMPAPSGIETATAALRAELADTTGEAHGMVGASNSPDGSGLVGLNTAGGADLILAGDDVTPDARLTESGLDRTSSSDQTFDFVNSGAGALTLLVEGVEAVTTATDQDTLAGLACATDEVAKWDGAEWMCAADDGLDTLGDLSCNTNEIVRWNGAAWECSTDADSLGALSCADTQVPQWNGAAWVCASVGTDTLASLSCDADDVVHWTGATWTCGQPSLTHLTCSDTGNPAACTMSCPAGSIVWTGGCGGNTSDSMTDSTPTDSSDEPTGWRCEAWDPLGSATVSGELYCVVR